MVETFASWDILSADVARYGMKNVEKRSLDAILPLAEMKCYVFCLRHFCKGEGPARERGQGQGLATFEQSSEDAAQITHKGLRFR